MKIENKNLIAKAAEMMAYEGALEKMSTRCDPEHYNMVATRAMQTMAVVSQRVDRLFKHLSDDEVLEIMCAALDLIAKKRKVDALRERAKNVMRRERSQLHVH